MLGCSTAFLFVEGLRFFDGTGQSWHGFFFLPQPGQALAESVISHKTKSRRVLALPMWCTIASYLCRACLLQPPPRFSPAERMRRTHTILFGLMLDAAAYRPELRKALSP